MLVVLALLVMLDVFTQYFLKDITNLEKILIYIVIFLIPIFVYIKLNKYKTRTTLRLHHFKMRYLPFILLAGITLSVVCALLNVICSALFSRFGLPTLVTSTVNFSSDSPFVIFVSAVFMPALCEELLIRGVALTEYEKYGIPVSVFMTSLIFALFHGSPVTFVSLFVAGAAYAVMTYLFKSVWPSFICHAINNLIAVFISYNSDFLGYLLTDILFVIMIIALVVLVLYFTLKLAENVVDELGNKNRLKTNTKKLVYGEPLASPYIWLFLAISIYLTVRRFL